MKTLQKILCAMLALLCIAGCASGTSDVPSDDTTSPAETTAEETTVPAETAPPLPDIKLDGHTVSLYKLAQDKIAWASVTFAPEESSSDLINDNIYKRNQRLMEEYKFVLKETADKDINKKIPTLSQAGDITYNLYLNRLNQISAQSLQGLFKNLRDVETLFLDEAWWDQGMIRDLELFGNMFFINGDVNPGNNDTVQVLFYNKGLADDMKITGIYDMVRDGKWTVDRMMEMMTKVTHDVNGDGAMDYRDRYGLLGSAAETVNSLFAGAMGRVAQLNSEGIPEIKANTEASEKAAAKIAALYAISGGNFDYSQFKKQNNGQTDREGIVMMFQAKNCLFFGNGISASAQYMRESDVDYGFLPYPKLDENQDSYYSKVSYSVPVFAIPAHADGADKTGLVLEILSRDSGESVMKDYYEVGFSAKYVRDGDSYEMLLIADSNHMYDPGNAFDWGKLGTNITSVIYSGSGTYMSTVDANKAAAETAIKTMVDSFMKAKQG